MKSNMVIETSTQLRSSSRRWARFIPSPESVIIAVSAFLAVGLILYPLTRLFIASFFSDVGFGQESRFTLDNYVRLVSDPVFHSAIVVTFVVSIATMLAATLVGCVLAWIVTRTNMPGARFLDSINIVPFFISPFVGAVSWTALGSPNIGTINVLFRNLAGAYQPLVNIYGVPGMVWVMTLFYAPFVYMSVSGIFRNMDPTLEEAARMSGASNWKVFRNITLPLALPSILSGGLLVLVTAAGAPDVPLALAKPAGLDTLSTLMYVNRQEYPPLFSLNSAIGMILLIVAVIGIYVQRAILRSRSFVTISGRGYKSGITDLGRWRYAALVFNLFYILIALVVPMVNLLMMSLSTYWSGSFDPALFTLQNFKSVLFDFELTRLALKNSLILAVSGATLAVALCTVLSYIIHRSRVPGRAALDFLIMLPISVPSVVMAMAMLLVWVQTPLYGTLFLLLVAYITRDMPIAQRNIAAAMLAVSPDLEESARMSGASWLRTMFHIVVPLLKSGIAAGWLLLFIVYLRELGQSILLSGAGTETFSVALYRMTRPVQTAAFAVVQVVILLVAAWVFRRIAGEGHIVQ